MKSFYTASATATHGRDGRVVGDGLDLELSVPKEFGGPGGEGTNPEQLFAAGYAACFGSALRHIAKVDLGDFTMTARVSIGKDGAAYRLAVELVGSFPTLSAEEGATLMEAAHQVCPYSNAVRGNVDVVLSVG